MNYLLDTNAVIALLTNRPPLVRERLRQEVMAAASMAISSVVLFELWYGVARSQHRAQNTERLRTFLAGNISVYAFEEEKARRVLMHRYMVILTLLCAFLSTQISAQQVNGQANLAGRYTSAATFPGGNGTGPTLTITGVNWQGRIGYPTGTINGWTFYTGPDGRRTMCAYTTFLNSTDPAILNSQNPCLSSATAKIDRDKLDITSTLNSKTFYHMTIVADGFEVEYDGNIGGRAAKANFKFQRSQFQF